MIFFVCNYLKGSNGWANEETSSIYLVKAYVGMGFPKKMVVKGIKEIGNTKKTHIHFICLAMFAPSV